MKTTNKYVFFWNGFLSQWHLCQFNDESGQEFSCAEQYMMFEKAALFHDTETAKKILNTESPREQKALGRKVENFNPELWETRKKIIVYRGNLFKFVQNERLLSRLTDTGNRTIVEASPYDKIWGIGMHEDDNGIENPKNWKGENLLGEILTTLRDNLKKGFVHEPQ